MPSAFNITHDTWWVYQRYLQEPRNQLKYYDDVHVDDDGGDGLNDRNEVANDDDETH